MVHPFYAGTADQMSRQFHQAGREMARCRRCDSDLVVRIRGKGSKAAAFAFCSNEACSHHRRKHPTGPELNVGKT